MRHTVLEVTLCLLALGLTAPTAALTGPPGDDDPSTGERRIKVVFTDDGGEEQILVDSVEGDAEIIFAGDEAGPLEMSRLLHPRAYLGVQMLEITPELRTHFGAERESGILISAVQPESPAALAGVAVGDVLVRVDDETVSRPNEVARAIAGREVDETVTLEMIRDRRALSLEATLAERQRMQIDLAPMFWHPAEGDHRIMRLPGRIIEIEKGDLDEAFSELHERLESPEWRQRLTDMSHRRENLEERIRKLEERLRQMETKLEETSGAEPE